MFQQTTTSKGRRAARILGLISFIAVTANATTVFYNYGVSDGTRKIAWEGSSTAFSGAFQWPARRKPLTRVNDTTATDLSTEADFSLASCDAATSRCTVELSLFFGRRLENGGLPNGTEVKFTTTGTLPGGLISWERNESKSYYILNWSGSTFQLSATPGGPAIAVTSGTGTGTNGMSFAGYSHVMAFRAIRAVPFQCDPNTDVCTTTVPHDRTQSTSMAYFHTTGTLPGGFMARAYGGQRMNQCLQILSPSTFKVRLLSHDDSTRSCSDWASLPVADLTSAGSGTHYLYTNQSVGNVTAKYGPVAFWSMKGYPQGTTLSFRLGSQPAKAFPWNPGNGTTRPMPSSSSMTATVVAKIPAVTAGGAYPVTIQTSESATTLLNPTTYTFNLKVVSLPGTPVTRPVSYPPIPGHKIGSSALTTGQCGGVAGANDCSWATWEYIMTSDVRGGGSATGSGPTPGATPGFRRCTDRKNPLFPQGMEPGNSALGYAIGFTESEAKLWYYSDETFFKIAQYTGDPTWANCGVHLASAMRNKFIGGGYHIGGYLYFPWMLAAAYRSTGDPTYRDAALLIAKDGTFAWGSTSDYAMREHAYAFERRLARRDLTGVEDYDLEQFADTALGMMYINAIGAPERMFHQTFMAGLVARPLIRWYAISHDERVPYVLKLWMDRAWDKWFLAEPILKDNGRKVSGFLYNPEPEGLRCEVTCAEPIGSNLNNLVAPMWAWYWGLTGNDLYRERGDTIFSRQYRDGYPYNAKEWSQGFYWSWDFVEWRTGKKPAD